MVGAWVHGRTSLARSTAAWCTVTAGGALCEPTEGGFGGSAACREGTSASRVNGGSGKDETRRFRGQVVPVAADRHGQWARAGGSVLVSASGQLGTQQWPQPRRPW